MDELVWSHVHVGFHACRLMRSDVSSFSLLLRLLFDSDKNDLFYSECNIISAVHINK